MDDYHITKDGKDWKLTREGANRAAIVAPTKEQIIQETRKFAQNKDISVKIHKENGRFQEERTYPRSKDPHESPG